MGRVRVRLAAALALAGCLQCAILLSVQRRHGDGGVRPAPGPGAVAGGGRDAAGPHPGAAVLETVRLLFMDDASAADDYLRGANVKGPGDFAFHVRELPSGVQTAESVASCMERWGYSKELAGATPLRDPSLGSFLESHCGWSSGELSVAGVGLPWAPCTGIPPNYPSSAESNLSGVIAVFDGMEIAERADPAGGPCPMP